MQAQLVSWQHSWHADVHTVIGRVLAVAAAARLLLLAPAATELYSYQQAPGRQLVRAGTTSCDCNFTWIGQLALHSTQQWLYRSWYVAGAF